MCMHVHVCHLTMEESTRRMTRSNAILCSQAYLLVCHTEMYARGQLWRVPHCETFAKSYETFGPGGPEAAEGSRDLSGSPVYRPAAVASSLKPDTRRFRSEEETLLTDVTRLAAKQLLHQHARGDSANRGRSNLLTQARGSRTPVA